MERVISRFGGVAKFVAALKEVDYSLNRNTVYAWRASKKESKNGQDGVIPNRHMPMIMEAARWAGVILTESDLDPRRHLSEAEEELKTEKFPSHSHVHRMKNKEKLNDKSS